MIDKMDLELNLEGGDEIKMEALRKFLYKLNEVIDMLNGTPYQVPAKESGLGDTDFTEPDYNK